MLELSLECCNVVNLLGSGKAHEIILSEADAKCVINEWPTAFFSLIEKPFVNMKMYFHGQIGLQEFPKVNSNTVFIGLLSCLSGEKEQLHKQRRSPFSALIIQPLRHGHLSSSPCPSPVLPSSPSSFLSALQLCFCPSGEKTPARAVFAPRASQAPAPAEWRFSNCVVSSAS